MLGGYGLVGFTVAETLLQQEGVEVVLAGKDGRRLDNARAKHYNFDLSFYDTLKKIVMRHEPDFIVNCAWPQPGFSFREYSSEILPIIGGLLELHRVEGLSVKRVFHLSSLDTMFMNTQTPEELCSYVGEQFFSFLREGTIIRLPSVTGNRVEYRKDFLSTVIVELLTKGVVRTSNRDSTFNILHVDDAAQFIVSVINEPNPKHVYNVAGVNCNLGKVFDTLFKVIGHGELDEIGITTDHSVDLSDKRIDFKGKTKFTKTTLTKLVDWRKEKLIEAGYKEV